MPFTHTFDIRFGSDGGEFIEGEILIDPTGKASVSITDSSNPLSADATKYFNKFLETLEEFYKAFDGVKKVEFVEKTP